MHDVFVRPLNEKELDRLENLLLKYGAPKAIHTLSELDGFFAALASSGQYIDSDRWLTEVGGKLPRPRKEAEEEAFHALLMRYLTTVAQALLEDTESFEPLFIENPASAEPLMVVDEWCEGYLRGRRVAQLPPLPREQGQHLEAITLHGLATNHGKARALTGEAYEASIDSIVEGMRALYRHSQR